jgi:hypothetical protein
MSAHRSLYGSGMPPRKSQVQIRTSKTCQNLRKFCDFQVDGTRPCHVAAPGAVLLTSEHPMSLWALPERSPLLVLMLNTGHASRGHSLFRCHSSRIFTPAPLTYIVPSERVHEHPPGGKQLAHVPVPIDRHVEVNRLWSRPAFHFQIHRRSAIPAVRFEIHTVRIAVWTVLIIRGPVRDPDDHPGVVAARAGRAAAYCPSTWRREGLL